jgi:hypothetical protein
MGDPTLPSPDDETEQRRVEHEIDLFIEQADALDGPPVGSSGERVAKLLRSTWDEVEQVTETLPKNKVIAMMLLLSREARQAPMTLDIGTCMPRPRC